MKETAKSSSTRDRLSQLRTARQEIVAQQRTLRPRIREAKQDGDDARARLLHDELRGLRERLHCLQDEERQMRGRDGAI
jgi:hypothetical protein